MKQVQIWLPDDIHRKFRIKLFEEDRTVKEFYLTITSLYVAEKEDGKKKDKPK